MSVAARRATRRSALAGAAAALSAPSVARARPERRNFVLIHGAWHGGWCWDRVARRLEAAGHRVVAPSLTGLADKAAALSRAVDLETHIGDVVAALRSVGPDKATLVGHSYGGLPITAAADRAPERVARLVYLDAVIVADGGRWSDTHTPALVAAWERAAAASGGVSVPPVDALSFGVTDPVDRAWVNSRLTPHPFATYHQPLRLSRPADASLPRLNIVCQGRSALPASARRVPMHAAAGWSSRTLDAGHDAMVTAPGALARLLLEPI
ncbi:MAG: alpha/beta hydrolase [Rhodospirillales bacterium]|nr:MAG: alpha/beta hydrolase [Rhodospirillales bacterium]